MLTETNCSHVNVYNTDVAPVCMDCEQELVTDSCMYSNPGAFLLMAVYSAFETGKLTEDQASELITNLGYTNLTPTP